MKTIGRPANRPEDVWRYVQIAGPEDCWPWTGATKRKGYGAFTVARKNCVAHRVAFQVATGVNPGDLWVLHKCDNPPCCNPAHLFLGTAGDNNRDCAEKQRTAHGERHRSAKLTAEQVRTIRDLSASGTQGLALADRFAVTPQTVSHIVTRQTWRHV